MLRQSAFVDYEYRINALGGSSPDYAYVDFYGPGMDPVYDGDKKGTFTLGAGNYAADDGCDCGCGVRDGDCTNGTVNSCEYCHCAGDALDCSTTSVRSTNNALCQ